MLTLIACGVIGLLPVTEDSGATYLQRVSGNVRIGLSEDATKPARSRMRLRDSDVLRLGSGASVVLVSLANGKRDQVAGPSTVTIKELSWTVSGGVRRSLSPLDTRILKPVKGQDRLGGRGLGEVVRAGSSPLRLDQLRPLGTVIAAEAQINLSWFEAGDRATLRLVNGAETTWEDNLVAPQRSVQFPKDLIRLDGPMLWSASLERGGEVFTVDIPFAILPHELEAQILNLRKAAGFTPGRRLENPDIGALMLLLDACQACEMWGDCLDLLNILIRLEPHDEGLKSDKTELIKKLVRQ